MWLDLKDIIEMPGSEKEFECVLDTAELDFPSVERFIEPPAAKGRVTNTAGVLTLTGRLRAVMLCICDRCSREFEHEKLIELNVPLSADMEDEGDDPDVFPVDGNGIDLDRDILKLAVIERHHGTGHMGLGFITGTGLKRGAIASSVSHDSHNLIVIGTNEADMAAAANRIRALGGGNVLVVDGEVRAEMPLPIAGLMSEGSAREVARENEAVRAAVHACGAPEGIEPFMNMAFVSLSVIPSLKMTTQGLVDVDRQQRVPLFV